VTRAQYAAFAIIIAAPAWLPPAMLCYHWIRSRRFGQFSLSFLMILFVAESLALTASIAFWKDYEVVISRQ
jgi:hypothetical protein